MDRRRYQTRLSASFSLKALRNTETETYTIRVDSKIVEELESGNTKSSESKWLRFTLDTVGQPDWAKDDQGRSLYPDGFTAACITNHDNNSSVQSNF